MGIGSSNQELKNEEDQSPIVNVVMLGKSGCGKSCLRSRLLNRSFKPYLGAADFLRMNQITYQFGSNSLVLTLSDYYDPIQNYSVDGYVIVYSIDSRESFHNVEKYFDDCSRKKERKNERKNERKKEERVEVVLIGNKSDLSESQKREGMREVSFDEGLSLAEKLDIPFFETSALDGKGVSEAFEVICHRIFDPSLPKYGSLLTIKRARH